MRPRVFPAEDRPAESTRRECAAGFNEAAGIPRGRRAGNAVAGVLVAGLQ